MFSPSVRAIVQLVVAARTGEARYAEDFERWPSTLADIESGRVEFEPPAALADRWVASGVLLLNSALTLSRFDVAVGPHREHGHLPLWRPVLVAVLRQLAARRVPLVCLGFGDAGASLLRGADFDEVDPPAHLLVVLRPHPAAAGERLSLANPLSLGNRHLESMDAAPVDW